MNILLEKHFTLLTGLFGEISRIQKLFGNSKEENINKLAI
jgi:hypothetical protein